MTNIFFKSMCMNKSMSYDFLAAFVQSILVYTMLFFILWFGIDYNELVLSSIRSF